MSMNQILERFCEHKKERRDFNMEDFAAKFQRKVKVYYCPNCGREREEIYE